MSGWRDALKRTPVLGGLGRGVAAWMRRRRGVTATESAFSHIFAENEWGDAESVSGTGSNLEQTRLLVEALPGLLKRHAVTRLLDVPCGDFEWMQRVDLSAVSYIGGDIVRDLVEANQARYGSETRRFEHVNLLSDALPDVDAVFTRDCLVHLSNAEASQALRNIVQSSARLLIATTFPERTENSDIPTGHWRPVNLCEAPFSLPAPIEILNEGCTEVGGAFADKSVGVWDLAAMRVGGR